MCSGRDYTLEGVAKATMLNYPYSENESIYSQLTTFGEIKRKERTEDFEREWAEAIKYQNLFCANQRCSTE